MGFMEEGAECVLMKGRRAGTKVTVTKVLEGGSFAVVKDEKGKERKCSVKHLMPAKK